MKISKIKEWVGIDGWRGYYIFSNSIYSSALLLEDEYGNKEVLGEIKTIKEKLRIHKFPFRTVKTNTSNCCSVGIDILVPIEIKPQVLEVI